MIYSIYFSQLTRYKLCNILRINWPNVQCIDQFM